ncbi:hypothetical protein FHS85_000769 [Rhodoligotrophos appendicifer]|uniref:sulfite exporter TauE/SafE family protein n=1 Tax=Rhodoligotrophos appendicifer TaxID=987056 RepID=UPI001184C6D3|nr:sulfite exporter TauE/SafE family protein [Rhodoligotrophos appendicifer]
MTAADVTFAAAVIAAVFFTGISKGGFAGVGMIATPLMALVMQPVQAASVLLPVLLIQDVYSVIAYRKNFDGRNLAFLLPGALVGIGLGYMLAAYLSQGMVSFAIGLIAILFSLRSLLRRPNPLRRPASADVAPGLFWGAVAGFTSMITHAGGPPFQIYVMPQRLSRDVFVGTGAVFFAVINWMKVPPYLMLGQITGQTLTLSLILAPLALVFTWVGIRLVRLVDTERFYLIAYSVLFCVGVKLCYDGLAFFF